MALALLWSEPEGSGGEALRLCFDIGRNRFYAWELGGEERVKTSGVLRIGDVAHRSGLLGPLPEEVMGRGWFEVPRELLSSTTRFVQLWSFRDRERNGPAISSILGLGRPNAFGRAAGDGEDAMSIAAKYSPERALPVDAVPMRWREREVSQTMFLGGLLSALPSILPAIAPTVGRWLGSAVPAIGKLLGGLTAGKSGTTQGGSAGSPGAADPIVQVLEQLLRTAAQSKDGATTLEAIRTALGSAATTPATAAPTGPATPPATAQSVALGSMGRRAATCAPRGYDRSRAAAMRVCRSLQPASYAQARVVSEAMVAPALLAALPALMPLLQQVLSPQNIQTLVDAPQKATGQIINGLIDFAKLGIQANEVEREHLRKLNPGVDNPALMQLLASMSLGLASARQMNYRRVASVSLSFDGAQLQVLFGRSRLLYRAGRELRFPMSLATPKPVRQARLVLQIKDPDTLAVLFEDSESIGDLDNGPVPQVPRVDPDQATRLIPDRDYIVVATLLWRTQKGSQVGTSKQQRISLVGEYSFDRLEEGAAPIAAADFQRYRDYWHKIWQGDYGAGEHSRRFACRYYVVLNPKRTNNARMDTHLQAAESGRSAAELRAGMEYSPYALNHLLPSLMPGAESLGEAELQALCSPDFVERFNQAAQYNAKLTGRKGERGALWVYPEFKVQSAVLVRAAEVDENGNVRALSEQRVRFPMPALMHFVGVQDK